MKSIEYSKNQIVKNLIFLREEEKLILKDGRSRRQALFKCGCGKEFIATIDSARSGQKSCGCAVGKSSLSHGMSGSRVYRQWRSMLERCTLHSNKSFVNYGGRGIIVCDEWKHSFKAYCDWALSNGYSDDLTIDRIDNDGNYEPSNCRFSTHSIQARNTRILIKSNSSGYRGVSKFNGKWMSRIQIDRKSIFLGIFYDKVDAAIAYDNYVIQNNLEHTINFK